MKVQVISLRRTPERLASFRSRNAIPALEIVRLDAVDGASIDRDALVQAGLVTSNLMFSNLALGCALSHISCWRAAADGGAALTVCEDDAVLRGDFVAAVARLAATQPAFDLIYWGFNLDMHVEYMSPGLGACASVFDEAAIRGGGLDAYQATRVEPLLYRARRLWGMPCYTVSPQGARNLLSRFVPICNVSATFPLRTGVGSTVKYCFTSQGIDMNVGVAHLPELAGYVAIPPLAVSPNDKAASTIGGHRRDIRHPD